MKTKEVVIEGWVSEDFADIFEVRCIDIWDSQDDHTPLKAKLIVEVPVEEPKVEVTPSRIDSLVEQYWKEDWRRMGLELNQFIKRELFGED